MKADGVGSKPPAAVPAERADAPPPGSGERFAAVLERGPSEGRGEGRGPQERDGEGHREPTGEPGPGSRRAPEEGATLPRNPAKKASEAAGTDSLAPFQVPAPVLQRPPPIARPAGAADQVLEVAQAIADRILEGAHVQADGAGRVEFVLDLRPEVLGGMRIRVRVEAGQVVAAFSAVQPEVRAALESQSHQLRQALRERGLELADLQLREEAEPDDGRGSGSGSGERNPGRGGRGR